MNETSLSLLARLRCSPESESWNRQHVNDLLIMLRRVQLAEDESDPNVDITGRWRVVSYEDDGRNLEYWKNIKLKIDRGVSQAVFRWYLGEKGDQEAVTVYEFDPGRNPGWIDESDKDGKNVIYELEGDTLRICLADERPTTFDSKPGSESRRQRHDLNKFLMES